MVSNVFDLGSTNVALALDCPFPANVNTGPGIAVVKSGGTWEVSLDTMSLGENLVPVPGNDYGAFYNTALGYYERVRMDLMIAAATGLDTRQPIVDSNYNVTIHDRYVALTMALTAPRIVTLPLAASVPGGREVVLEDEVGGLSSVNSFSVQPTGTDTINGGASYVMATPYGGARFRSDGTSRWSVVNTSNFYLVPAGATTYTASPDGNVIAWPAFTAPVVTTLPAASAYPKGRRLTVADRNGSCTPTNTMAVHPAGSDTINGVAAPAIATMNAPYSTITLFSDGVSAWTVAGGGNLTAAASITSSQISDASTLGRQLLTNTTAALDRTALGSGAVGDSLFTSTTQAAAQGVLGLGTMATQSAAGVNITGGNIAGVAIANGTITNAAITTPTISGGTISGVSANGAVTLSPANANIAISPTGTGTVTMNPATAGHIDNTIIGATVPAAASITSLNGGQLAGQRNMVMNGRGIIDQRWSNGTSTPSVANVGVYFGDRWEYYATQASKFNVNCGGSIGGFFNGTRTSIGASVASAVASPAAADGFQMYHMIEGLVLSRLGWGTTSGLPATLSFDAYTNVAGTHCVSLSNGAATRNYVATYTLTANAWNHVTLTIPPETTGAWNSDNTIALMLRWILGYGSSYVTASPNTWVTTGSLAVAGAVNLVTQSGGSLSITNVQLEQGSIATPFEVRLHPDELNMCLRYYERKFLHNRTWAAGIQTIQGVQVDLVYKRTTATANLIAAGTRSNLYSASVGVSGPNSAIFNIVSTAAGDCYVIGDSWEFTADL